MQQRYKEVVKKELVPEGTQSIKYTTNSKGETLMIMRDSLGSTTIVNTEEALETSNEEAKVMASDASMEPPNPFKSVSRVLVDNSLGIVTGYFNVLGTLSSNISSRLLDHMVDSMEPREAAFFGIKQGEDRDIERMIKEAYIKEDEEFRRLIEGE